MVSNSCHVKPKTFAPAEMRVTPYRGFPRSQQLFVFFIAKSHSYFFLLVLTWVKAMPREVAPLV